MLIEVPAGKPEIVYKFLQFQRSGLLIGLSKIPGSTWVARLKITEKIGSESDD